MTIVVVGAGAIGGYAAYALEKAGQNVVLCVRKPFHSLTVETEGRAVELSATVITNPSSCPEGDWVLLATKTHQTSEAGPWIRAACGPSTRGLAVLQNGVEHAARVGGAAGTTPVLPVVVRCSAEAVSPGRVRHSGRSVLEVPVGTLGEDLASCFAGGPMNVLARDDFDVALWRKLLQNVTASPITALTGRRMEVMNDDSVAELAHALAVEAVAVANAAGIPLSNDDATTTVAACRSVSPTMGTSMLSDRLAGRELEVDDLTGAVVRLGDELGVPVPLNRAMATLLNAMSKRGKCS